MHFQERWPTEAHRPQEQMWGMDRWAHGHGWWRRHRRSGGSKVSARSEALLGCRRAASCNLTVLSFLILSALLYPGQK